MCASNINILYLGSSSPRRGEGGGRTWHHVYLCLHTVWTLSEADSPSRGQEIHRIYNNHITHYGVHMSPPFTPIQSQINPAYVPSPYFFRINFNIFLPSTPVSSKWLLLSGNTTKTPYCLLLSSMRAACLVHLILHNFTTRIFVEANKRWSSQLCSLLKFPVTSSLFDIYTCTRVGTLIVANTRIYLQLIQNRYMFRSFTVLQCSHQHCVQPVASDVEVVGYL